MEGPRVPMEVPKKPMEGPKEVRNELISVHVNVVEMIYGELLKGRLNDETFLQVPEHPYDEYVSSRSVAARRSPRA